MFYNGHSLKKRAMYSGVLASTFTLTEELFTGHVELPSDHHTQQIHNVFIYFFFVCVLLCLIILNTDPCIFI